MSRSCYVDDLDMQRTNLWRGTVERALKGKRGQAFLRELAAALDAMAVKELIADELVNPETGACCAIGAVCKARGTDVRLVDYYDPASVGYAVGISAAMAAEIEYMNDEWYSSRNETPAQRWARMRQWVGKQIRQEA